MVSAQELVGERTASVQLLGHDHISERNPRRYQYHWGGPTAGVNSNTAIGINLWGNILAPMAAASLERYRRYDIHRECARHQHRRWCQHIDLGGAISLTGNARQRSRYPDVWRCLYRPKIGLGGAGIDK